MMKITAIIEPYDGEAARAIHELREDVKAANEAADDADTRATVREFFVDTVVPAVIGWLSSPEGRTAEETLDALRAAADDAFADKPDPTAEGS